MLPAVKSGFCPPHQARGGASKPVHQRESQSEKARPSLQTRWLSKLEPLEQPLGQPAYGKHLTVIPAKADQPSLRNPKTIQRKKVLAVYKPFEDC